MSSLLNQTWQSNLAPSRILGGLYKLGQIFNINAQFGTDVMGAINFPRGIFWWIGTDWNTVTFSMISTAIDGAISADTDSFKVFSILRTVSSNVYYSASIYNYVSHDRNQSSGFSLGSMQYPNNMNKIVYYLDNDTTGCFTVQGKTYIHKYLIKPSVFHMLYSSSYAMNCTITITGYKRTKNGFVSKLIDERTVAISATTALLSYPIGANDFFNAIQVQFANSIINVVFSQMEIDFFGSLQNIEVV